MDFCEVSAKDGTNINEMFERIGRSAYEKIKKLGDKGQNNNIVLEKDADSPNTQTGRSCSC
jgi:GTPase SAR1 family protein